MLIIYGLSVAAAAACSWVKRTQQRGALEIIGARIAQAAAIWASETPYFFLSGAVQSASSIIGVSLTGTPRNPPVSGNSSEKVYKMSLCAWESLKILRRSFLFISGGPLSLFLISPDYSHTSVFPPRITFARAFRQSILYSLRRAFLPTDVLRELLTTFVYFAARRAAGLRVCEARDDDSPEVYYKRELHSQRESRCEYACARQQLPILYYIRLRDPRPLFSAASQWICARCYI